MKNTQPALPRWKLVLGVYIGAVLVGCLLFAGLLVFGWRPDSPSHMPSLEASAQQCEAAFGHPFATSSNMEELHRWSQLFYTKGWSVIISYDEQRRAEQFIFCKTQLPFVHPPSMSAAEQARLLSRFSAGSTWQPPEREAIGPIWTRKDQEAYALYQIETGWLIIMNKAGCELSLKAHNIQIID